MRISFMHVAWLFAGVFALLAPADLAAAQPKKVTERLVVIAPKSFHASLADYIRYKKRQMPVELVSLEEVLKTCPGVDDPEKVKRYLHQAWYKRNAGYALLVGDADVFPVRYMVLDRITPEAFDYAFYPSDLYYADLVKKDGSFEDWNAQKDDFHAGYYGEVRGEKNKSDPINFDAIDYLPEIAVGRWPVSTPEEVSRVAAKTMRYEEQAMKRTVPSPRRVVWMGVGGWVDSRPLLERLAQHIPAGWVSEKRFYKDQRDYGTPPPTHEELLNLLNGGAGLVCHTGHGQDLAWEQCLSSKDLTKMNNAQCLPVMISIGCSTARFATLPPYEPYMDVDGNTHKGTYHKEVFTAPPRPPACYQKGPFNPPGLGEMLLRAGDNGAVAYIGCSTGSQPCALSLLEGFTGAFGNENKSRLGDCWNQAIRFYYEHENLATLKPQQDWYPPSIFFQGMKFMLFGDPSLRMKPDK